MASLSRKIKRAQLRKSRHAGTVPPGERSLERLQKLGAGVGGALVLLTLPAVGIAADGFTQVQDGKTTTFNQTAPKVYNRVNSYNIAADELHRYNQPSLDAVFVQRVMGGDYSSILGQLIANGQVWIMNPGGVLIGSQATVNTAGFLATSLVMGEDDFFAGRYLLKQEGKDGFVINRGTITVNNGGYAILAGGSVVNNGYIQANMGEVVLASGRAMTMDFNGDGLINFAVDEKVVAKIAGPDGADLTTAVLNTGRITADGGRVTLTARDAAAVLDSVVNNTGVIEAKSAVERNGEIILLGGDEGVVANSGTLDVSGHSSSLPLSQSAPSSPFPLSQRGTQGDLTGGTVKVLGEYVGLFDGARIDASGDAGGGTILVGGNFQGKGPEPNALRAFVGNEAIMNADAVNRGNGGKVVVWSDDATRFHGSISARGGALSGNGGSVEVSGKQGLAFDGKVDLSASQGAYGTLLLDPDDIYINGAGHTDGNGSVTAAQLGDKTWNAATDYDVSDAAIATALKTANVTLAASHDIATAAAVSIDPNDATAVNTRILTLSADNNVIIGHSFDLTNTAGASGPSLVLNATNGILLGNTVTTKGGSVSFNNAVTLTGASQVDTTAGGALGNNIIFGSTVNGAQNLELIAGLGDAAVTGVVGTAAGDGANNLTSFTVGAAQASLNDVFTSGTQSVTADAINLNGTSYASSDGSLLFAGAAQLNNDVTVTSGGAVGNNITFDGTIDGAQNLELIAGLGDAAVTGVVGTAAGDGANNLTSFMVGAAQASLNDVFTSGTQSVTADAINLNGTSYASSDGSLLFAGATQLNNDVTATSGGAVGNNITFDGTVNGAQSLELVAGLGDAAVTGVVGTAAGDVANNLTSFTVGAAQASLNDVFTSGTQSVTADAINLNGTTYESSNGSLLFTGAAVTTGDLELVAGGAAVTLTNVEVNTLAVYAPDAAVDITTAAPLGTLSVGTVGLTDGITADSLVLTETAGDISIDQAVAVTTTATLDAAGNITDSGWPVAAEGLELVAGGTQVTLSDAEVNVLAVYAPDAAVDITTTAPLGTLSVGTVGLTDGITADNLVLTLTTGDISIDQAVAVTTTATLSSAGNITDSGWPVGAAGLEVLAGGAQVTLSDAQVNTLAVYAPDAAVDITTAAPLGTLSVGTVGLTDGIIADSLVLTETAGDISIDQAVAVTTTATLDAAGNITDSGWPVAAEGLELVAGGTQVTLSDAEVNVLAVYAPDAAVDITTTALLGTLSVGTVGLTDGITADGLVLRETTGDLSIDQAVAVTTVATFSAAGNITDSGFPVSVSELELIAGGTAITLANAEVNSLAVYAPDAAVNITTAAPLGTLSVGTVGATDGITSDSLLLAETTGDISIDQAVAVTTTATLSAAGNITDSGFPVSAAELELVAGGATISLSDVQADTLAVYAPDAAANITTTAPGGTLSVGTVGSTDGITADSLSLTETAGNISIDQAAVVTTVATLSAAGNITDSGFPVSVSELELIAGGTAITLANAEVNSLAVYAPDAAVDITTAAPLGMLSVGTVGGTDGITSDSLLLTETTGDISIDQAVAVTTTATLSAAGNIMDSGFPVAADGLELIAGGAAISLSDVQANTLAVYAPDAAVNVTTAAPGGTLSVGTVGATDGITADSLALTETAGDISIDQAVAATTTATLDAAGNITDSGFPVAADSLELVAGGAAVTLSDVQTNTLAVYAPDAAVDITTAAPLGTLSVGTVGGTDGITSDSLLLTETTGEISIDQPVTVATTAMIAATVGDITGDAPVAVSELEVVAGGATVILADAQVNTLAVYAPDAAVDITTTAPLGSLSVGTVGATDGITSSSLILTETTGDLSIDQAVAVTTTATLAATAGNITDSAWPVAADGLGLIAGGGTVTLTDARVNTLAVNAPVATVDITATATLGILHVGAVGTTTGIASDSLVLTETTGATSIDQVVTVTTTATLAAAGNITNEEAQVAAEGLELLAGGTTVTLADARVNTLAVNAPVAAVNITATAPLKTLSVGTVGATAGITSDSLVLTETTGDLSIDQAVAVTTAATLAATAGNITDSGWPVAADGLEVIAGGTTVMLTNAQVNSLAVNAPVAVVNITAAAPLGTLTVGTVGTTNGITSDSLALTETTGDISINQAVTVGTVATLAATAGNIADSGAAVTAVGLEVIAGGAQVTLTDARVDILAVNASEAAVDIATAAPSGTLSVGTVGATSGIAADSLILTETIGDLSIDQPITAATTATLAATLGNITDSGFPVGAAGLEVIAGGATVALSDVEADTLAVYAPSAAVDIATAAPSGTLSVGTVGATDGIQAGSLVLTETAGDLSIDQAVGVTTTATLAATLGNITDSGFPVGAAGLEVIAGGATVTLSDVEGDTLAVYAPSAAVDIATAAPSGTLSVGTVGATDGIMADSLVLTEGFGDLNIDQAVSVTTQATLTAAGNITDSGWPVAADSLELIAGGAAVTLTDAEANTLAVYAPTAAVNIATAAPNGTLTVGTAGTTDGITADSLALTEGLGDLSIDQAVTVATQATLTATLGNITDSGVAVAADGLEVVAGGATVTLTDAEVNVLAVYAPAAAVNIATAAPSGTLSVGTVGATDGIAADSLVLTEGLGDLSIDQAVAVTATAALTATAGNITDSGWPVAADGLEVIAGGTQVTLTDAEVNMLAVYAPGAAVNIATVAPLGTMSVGTVGTTDGITADSLVLTETIGDLSIDQLVSVTTTATLSAAGNITDSGWTVGADGLEVVAGGTQVSLSDVEANTLAVYAPAAAVDIATAAPSGTLSVGTVGTTDGITADSLVLTEGSGDLSIDQAVAVTASATLSAAGNITDSGWPVAADGLEVIAGGTQVTLTDAEVNMLAVYAPAAAVDITTAAPLSVLSVGTVGTTDGITADSLVLTETIGDLSIDQGVEVTTTATLAAAGNITDSGWPVVADGLEVIAGGTQVSLSDVAANALAVYAPAAAVDITTSALLGTLSVGTVGATDGITADSLALTEGLGNIAVLRPIQTATGPVTVTAAGMLTIDAEGDITAGGAIDLTAPGGILTAGDIAANDADILFNDAVTLTGPVRFMAGTGTVTVGSTLAAAANDLEIQADHMAFNGGTDSVSGTSTILLHPSADGTSIGIGDGAAGTLQLTTTEIDALADGFSQISIGTPVTGAHEIHVNAVTFKDPVMIQAPAIGGQIFVDGQITGIDNASITLDGPDATTYLNADIVTTGNSITISDSVIIGAADAVILDTTMDGASGANITITGTVDDDTAGTSSLVLNSGVTGEVTIAGAAGNANNLVSFTVTGAQANLNDVFTSGTQAVTADAINLNGTTYASADGSLLFAGATQLNNDVTVTSGGALGNDITFDGTVDGARHLDLSAGAGNVTMTGAAGGANNLTSLTVTGAQASLNDVLTIGTQAVTADAINLNGTTYASSDGSLLFAGATQLNNDVTVTSGGAVGNDITFDGTIDGAQSLDLTAGLGNVMVTGTVGTAAGNANNPTSITVTGARASLNDVFTSGNQVVTAAEINLDGTTYTSTDGSLLFAGATQLNNDVTVTSGQALGNNITFDGTVDGNQSLDLAAGAGDVTITGLAGDTLPFGAITIVSANNVTTNGVRAASFTQTAGQGLTTLNGGAFTDGGTAALATTDVAGVSIAAKDIAVNDKITAAGGPVTLNATDNGGGTLTIATGSDITAGGTVDLTATGSIATSGNITTSAPANINVTSITGDVAMADGTVFTTTFAGGSGNVDIAAAGNILLGQISDVGGTATLSATGGAITDNNGGINNVTAAALKATAAAKIGEVGNAGVFTANNVLKGPGNALETAVSTLNVTTTNALGATEIAVDNTLAGTLTPSVTLPAGNGNHVWIRNSQDLNVATPLAGGTARLDTKPNNNYGFIAASGTLTVQDTGINPLNIGTASSLNLQGGATIVGLGGSAAGTADVAARDFLMKTGAGAGNVSVNTDVTNLDTTVTGTGKTLTIHQVTGAAATGLNVTDLDGDTKSVETNAGAIGIYQDNQDKNLTVAGAAAAPGYTVDAKGADITLQVNPVAGGLGHLLIGSDATNHFATVTTDGGSIADTGIMNITGGVNIFGTLHSTAGRTLSLTAPSATITIDQGGFTGSGSLTLDPGNVPGGTSDIVIASGGDVVVHGAGADPGNLTIQNADNFTMGADSSIAVDGGVTVQNIAGTTTLNNVSLGVGNFTMTNAGSTVLNGVLNANGHDVSIDLTGSGGGSLTAGAGGLISNTGSLTIRTLNNIGTSTSSPVNTNATNITLQTTGGDQPIFVANTPGATPTMLTATTAGGDLNYSQTGGGLITGTITTNGGQVIIDPPVDVTVTSLISSGGADVVIDATNNITLVAGGNIQSGGGKVLLNGDSDASGAGAVVFSVAGTGPGNNSIVYSAGGQVDVFAETITLKDYAIDSGAGTATLTAGRLASSNGAITGQAGGGSDISGGVINLNATSNTAQTVIGTAGAGNGLDVNPTTVVNAAVSGSTAVPRSVNIAGTGALPVGAINVDASNSGTSGDVTLAANGAITDANGAQQNITARNLTITGAGTTTVQLGATTLSGTLDIASQGNITENGVLTVAGASSFNANNNTISLDSANLLTGPVTLTGTSATLNNAMATNLGVVNTTNLNVTSGGNITDSGAIMVSGITTLNAGTNDIVLDTATNNFGTIGITNGNNVTLVNNAATNLAVSNVSGNLSVASAGAITDSGALFVSGSTTLTAGAGNDIILDTPANDFVGPVNVASSRNFTFSDANNFTVGDMNAANSATITAAQSILNDGIVGTMLSAPTANLVATAGTIGAMSVPLEVDITGALFVSAGGTQNGLSASLQGQVGALTVDPAEPGLAFFNDAQPGAPLGNGKPVFSGGLLASDFFQGTAQNTAELANEAEDYALTLDIYGDAVFAPYGDMIDFMGAGVAPDADEEEAPSR